MKCLSTIFLITLIVFSHSNTTYSQDQPFIMLAESEVIQKKQVFIHETQRDGYEVIQKKQETILNIQNEAPEVSQKKQLNNIPQLLEPEKQTKDTTKEDAKEAAKEGEKEGEKEKRLLKSAWDNFNQGNYNQAIKNFTEISSSPITEKDAKYGLALCYISLKNTKKAIPLLESLVNKEHDLKNTLHILITSLVDENEFQKAEAYLPMLTKDERQNWEETIKSKKLMSDFDRYKKAGDINNIVELTKNNDDLLKKCLFTGLFYDAAGAVVKHNKEYSIDIYKNLLDSCNIDIGLRLGIIYSLKAILPYVEMLSILDTEDKLSVDSDYKKKIADIRLSIFVDKLYALPSDSPEIEGAAREILALNPKDDGVRLMLAWRFLNSENYEHAFTEFNTLYSNNPKEKDYSYGLLLSLIKLKRYDEGLELARKHSKTDPRIVSLEADILSQRLDDLSPDSSEFEDTVKELLAKKPEDVGIRLKLAWIYYSNDLYEKSYEQFQILYKLNPEMLDSIYGMGLTLQKLNRDDEALELVIKNKDKDERLDPKVKDICLEMGNTALKAKKYKEAELYYKWALAEDPKNEELIRLSRLSKYKQTILAGVLSPILGLPGESWVKVSYDLDLNTGIGLSFFINQGIDWVKLPGDIILNTYGEYRYSNRTSDSLYFNERGQALGIDLKKSPFKLGVEFYRQIFSEQGKINFTGSAYFLWYYDWYKFVRNMADDSWFSIDALSGNTYGKIFHDLSNPSTGNGISASISQGIDWITLPGVITLNTHVDFSFKYRTKDNYYYNSYGPAVSIELQKKPFRLGVEYLRNTFTQQNVTQKTWTLYLVWNLFWDLKPQE